jgi:oligopeptide transport system substrate-binding protein
MNRVLLIPTLVLIVLGALCFWISAGKEPTAVGGKGLERPIVICNGDEIKTLDPGQMSWANDIRVAMAMWEGLTAYDPDTLKPVPGVAEKWDISPDGKTYTFHLRHDARWSNGEPVTSADFMFAWKRTITPATGADYGGLFNVIVGAEDFLNAPADKPGDFSKVGIKAPDDHTLVVQLKAPCGYFLDLCAFPPFFPLNEKAMAAFLLDKSHPEKGWDGKWTRPPAVVSNGPYVLDDWKFKQYLSLKPNPQNWDKANVKCSNVVIKGISDSRAALLAYRAGALDVLTFVPQQFGDDLVASGWKDVHYRPVFGSYYYIINCTRKPFDDPRVRKALALAIDKQKIVRDVTHMNQKPLGVIVPPDSIPGYTSPEGLPMDVEQAKKLLADAGFPEGKGFPTVEIMTTNEVTMHSMVAQAIGQMWKQNLGIETSYRSLERGSFGAERRQSHNFDIARGGWYGDYVDPTTWLDLLRTGDGNNDGQYSNKAYDSLLARAALEPDAASRFKLLHDAEAMLMHDEFPLIPLYQYGDGCIFDDNKIAGFTVNVRLLTPLKWIRRK